MEWETVIGLEVHVQLATRSKIFSVASTAFGAPPNTQASPVDLGLPGVLPVLNRDAVRMAVTFGLAIGATINRESRFDRKNYFYPDLPKGYQISQFEEPIVGAGALELALSDGTTMRVGITRAHLEEDAGKSMHEDFAGMTGIDLNRAGMPLLEIVSEPDLRSAEQAAAYFREMHALVRYLRICDGNLNEGSMRCDANVSIRPRGETALGERTEIKNLNSFRFLEQAINAEIARQIELREAGEPIVRETLLYDPARNQTRPMRSKELSDDYRYFPEPDLLPVVLEDAFVDAVRATLPELPSQKRVRYQEALGLGAYDATVLTAEPDVAAYFEAVAAASGESKLAANWVMGDLAGALNRHDLDIVDSPVSPDHLAALIRRIQDGTISTKIAKTLFDLLWERADASVDVDALIDEQGLRQVSDTRALEALVQQVIADNPKSVADYKAGKEKALGALVGRVMKATQGKANPRQLNDLLRDALAKA
jgi:aspartyl-tRNA(Asn)/glutamyl-tRNA(Gln) amidotransferase subunit B